MKYALIALLLFSITTYSCKNDDNTGKIYELIPVKKGKEFTYINLEGKQMFNSRFKDATVFRDGLALVQETGANSLWGYINKRGEYVIKPKFKAATIFSEGLAWVVESGKAPVVINEKGEIQFELKNANSVRIFQEGVAAFSVLDRQGDEIWGFVDKIGKVVIEPEYPVVWSFRNGKCAVSDSEGNWGYLDNKGNIVLDFYYTDATNFINDKAIVARDKKYGIIDINGNMIVDFQYGKIYFSGNDFIVAKDGKFGLIDNMGENIIPIKYLAAWSNNGDDAIPFQDSDGWGYVKSDGTTEISFQFDESFPFNANRAVVLMDGKYGLIKRDGAYVVNPKYDEVSLDYLWTVNNNIFGDYTFRKYKEIETDYFDIESIVDFLDINKINEFDMTTTFGNLIDKYEMDSDAFLPFNFAYNVNKIKLNKFATVDFVVFGCPYELVWTNQTAGYYSYSVPKKQFTQEKRPDKYLFGFVFRNGPLAMDHWNKIREKLNDRMLEYRIGDDLTDKPMTIYQTSDFEIHVHHGSYLVEYILTDQSQ